MKNLINTKFHNRLTSMIEEKEYGMLLISAFKALSEAA